MAAKAETAIHAEGDCSILISSSNVEVLRLLGMVKKRE